MERFQFHPVIAQWFARKFGTPTEPQERGWPAIQSGAHTLIAAPTGSGKTLAAFLAALDALFREGLAGTLGDETRVLYVSPLKALSNDIHKNLEEPLAEIREALKAAEGVEVAVRAQVRTGDTPASQRQAIARRPPHILVTTPESLYLLLTSVSGRKVLSTVRTLIVDEIHAVIGNRRGSHLALSMERLAALTQRPLQRIGLSATQKPIEEVARFLVGANNLEDDGAHSEGGLAQLGNPESEALDGRSAGVKSRGLEDSHVAATGDGHAPWAESSQQHAERELCAPGAAGRARCEVIDSGHMRALDIAIELPGSPLEAVMSNEVWGEVYERLVGLISAHRTTLVFVNTRRLAERVAYQLCARLGKDKVTSHHGSLSTKLRLDAENRLKRGELQALVATSSLELGIDIGSVDLVCQLGSTRSIASLLQRVGRAEHKRGGLPKGRLFPLTRDELIECVAALRCIRRGELDVLHIPPRPLDILAQQIVAAAASEDWDAKELFKLVKSAYPYRDLGEAEFREVVQMLAEGFSTKRGRRAALIHHDAVNDRLRGRRGARLVALTSGGAIPDNADYRVVVEPGDTVVGTVNEDFAVESMAGDIFQLGNTSWKISQIISGTVRVTDAQGQPPGMPFWLGEGPSRTNELSHAVSSLRDEVQSTIEQTGGSVEKLMAKFIDETGASAHCPRHASEDARAETPLTPSLSPSDGERVAEGRVRGHIRPGAIEGSVKMPPAETGVSEAGAGEPTRRPGGLRSGEGGISEAGARQMADYFAAGYKALGVIPSQQRIVMERFFDESGGMQLVIHSPFGARINRAWGLALRKRFCRSFNFELQAAATDDAIVLSLGTQHSFPLDEVFRYLGSKTVREVLVQALLDAPMFPIRWRWNASRALALPRQRGGRKVPAPLQRMESENLLAAVFPDQLACLENIVGDREVPDQPLVKQTIEDCLTEAMDIDGLEALLRRIETGQVECVARDLPEPSPLAHEILNARPYAFLDNAPLEERRTQAVHTRRASDSASPNALGILDAAAIERVCAEAWPTAANADELHDTLMLLGVMTDEEALRCASNARELLASLAAEGRAGRLEGSPSFWVAAERLPMVRAVYPARQTVPALNPPEAELKRVWEPEQALRELVRGRSEVIGPFTAAGLATSLSLPQSGIDAALLALEAEGFVLRGKFHPGAQELEWCERRLLARIHRLTLNRLRAEIQPVSLENFQRFLLAWQRVDDEHRAEGPAGVEAVLELLDGMELAAAAWEPEVLALRVKDYTPQWLDQLCLTGRIGWGRLSPPQNLNARAAVPLRSTPIAVFDRENLATWLELSERRVPEGFTPDTELVLKTLAQMGAMFFGELARETKLLPSRVAQALGELSACGVATADSFEGLRALLVPAEKRAPLLEPERRRRHKTVTSIEFAGRWTLLGKFAPTPTEARTEATRPGEGVLPKSKNPKLEALEARTACENSRNLANSHVAAPGDGRSPGLGQHASDEAVELFARVLLRRYGVMFRRLLERESLRVSWYELGRVCRRLEAQGEIRGGHFVSGVSGEQFALPEAIGLLRSVRKAPPAGELKVISAADPLNLVGVLTPGSRITAITANCILLRDGLPIAALNAGQIQSLDGAAHVSESAVRQALMVRTMAATLRPYYG